MRILSFGNVGNFQTGYKDGIVVLTRLRGLLTTSVSQVSYDLQVRVWLAVPRFFVVGKLWGLEIKCIVGTVV